jgi:ABC-2 type transport system permease protein
VVAAYRAVVGSRLRSQLGYRTSFGLDVLSSTLLATVDLAEVYILFHNVDLLGGLDFGAALLVFGLAHLGFALANGVAGSLDQMPVYIRAGSLDVFLLRPQPLLAQLVTGDIALKRLGAAGVAGVVLAGALTINDIAWTLPHIVLLAVTPLVAAALFAALFLAAGAVQFWFVEAAEVTNGFTYGSSYASSFSAAVLPLPLRVFFTFVVPAAFTAYLPAVAILDLPSAPGLPGWLGWAGPAAAVAAWAVALALWRKGIGHYSGAGG